MPYIPLISDVLNHNILNQKLIFLLFLPLIILSFSESHFIVLFCSKYHIGPIWNKHKTHYTLSMETFESFWNVFHHEPASGIVMSEQRKENVPPSLQQTCKAPMLAPLS